MLFNSHVFLLAFLPVAVAGWWLVRGDSRRLLWATACSYLFYGYWDWRFAALMLGTSALDYWLGGRISASEDPRTRRAWLALSVSSNLGVLGLFKYYGFFASSVNAAAEAAGLSAALPLLQVVLPVGISFYTFQSLAYTIDLYRRDTAPASSLLEVVCFVSLFPQLVAGPIVRYGELASQLRAPPLRPDWRLMGAGALFLTLGLAKKVLVADPIARGIDPLFAAYSSLSSGEAWLAALGFSCQVYFDFSGYSDMAVGLGLFLGLRFPRNFASPYQASDIADFWRRWHITLSVWLRDYLYIPLGGSRRGAARTFLNLFLTMLLGGLWHGANWTFVAWGVYQGALVAGHRLLRETGLTRGLPAWLGRGLTFLAVVSGFVVFRSESLPMALRILGAMFEAPGTAAGGAGLGVPWTLPALVAGALALAHFAKDTGDLAPRPTVALAAGLGLLLCLCTLKVGSPSPFLYFQF